MLRFICFILIASATVFAGTFEITEELRELPTDMTALTRGQPDVNGDPCALIKLFSNIDKDLIFENRNHLEDASNRGQGEYWLYMRGGARNIAIKKEGFMPVTYPFPFQLEQGKTYRMSLQGIEEVKKIEEITVTIETNPSGAEIYFDGENKGYVEQIRTTVGRHELKIVRSGYEDRATVIDVSPRNNVFKIDLVPKSQTVTTSPQLIQHGATASSGGVAEWEILGLTRDEYLHYRRIGISINKFNDFKKQKFDFSRYEEYNKKTQYRLLNSFKSLLLPGWGQYSAESYTKAKWHFIIEGVLLVADAIALHRSYYNDNFGGRDVFVGTCLTTHFFFRLYSPIDAWISTNHYNNKILTQKYQLSLSPTYNPRNNGVGMGLTVNF